VPLWQRQYHHRTRTITQTVSPAVTVVYLTWPGYSPHVTNDLAFTDLLALLAYGQLQAFDQMAADARQAPDLRRRAALSAMASAEMAGYHRLIARLREQTGDPYAAMAPFVGPLDAYHEQTEPKDWLEALVKAYVGDGIADDFYAEVAAFLEPDDRAFVLDIVHDERYTTFAANEIRAAIAADPKVASPLSMWARRLVGEALSQALHVGAERPPIAVMIEDLPELLKRITAAHSARMLAVGLNN
jgi:hypothetical protein